MRCTRVIEYEASSREELERHLARTLMSQVPEVRPGMNATEQGGKPMMLFGGYQAPQVCIRLVAEQWQELEPDARLDAEAQLVGGSVMQRSVEELVRACELLLVNEVNRAAPDNALVAVLCDVVRYTRETTAHAMGQCNTARRPV